MKHLPTVSRAKEEIEYLQDYVLLAETYHANTLEKKIIKLYAYTGSLQKVTAQINEEREAQNLSLIDATFVSRSIQSKPKDPLHKLLRANYLQKTKHIRTKSAERGQYSY
ncbi:hypothetical protein [Planococcus sp. ISL-109]|uniref:hypothetical protein n=1 Tax=Planococcus sp. ISL-109 TaxID=2819166 RepID=UPI001BEBF151|nr:hypothetical protein [Planococcus sp. ISL-109]MBT2583119.1 hypothetical protein [Planococcus sp. ISL-109]